MRGGSRWVLKVAKLGLRAGIGQNGLEVGVKLALAPTLVQLLLPGLSAFCDAAMFAGS